MMAALLGTLLLLGACQQGPGTPPVRDDDHGNSPSTATQLVAGQSPSTENPPAAADADHPLSMEFSADGSLTAGDLDYFVITVSQAGTLTASTSGSTDTYGYLEARTSHHRRTVLDEDDNSGAGRNFRVTAQVSPGLYYIGVMGSSITTTGYYELSVTFSSTPSTGREADTERLMGVWKAAFYEEDGHLFHRRVLSFTETRYTEHVTSFDENDGRASNRWTDSGGWKVTGPSEIVFSYEDDGEIRTRPPGSFLWQDNYQTLVLRYAQLPYYTIFTRDDSPPVDLEGVWRLHGGLRHGQDTVREVITFTPTHFTYVEVRTIDGTDHDLVTTGTWAAGPDNMLLWTIEDSSYGDIEPGDELRLAYAPTGSADRIVVSDFADEMDYRDGEWVPNGFFGRYRMELVRQ